MSIAPCRCAGLAFAFVLAACGTATEPPQVNDIPAAPIGGSARYAVYLRGAITDTLYGAAGFGDVVDTRRGGRRFVIVLQSIYDPQGGFFLVRGQAAPPEPGTYAFATPRPDSGTYGGFRLVYRLGMRRNLAATSGTLTLTTVRDTLIEGTFEAVLRGNAIREGERLSDARVRARGTFRAGPRPLDMIVGL